MSAWKNWRGLDQKSVVGHEYAPPNTGASITHGNSENGALPTREPERCANKGGGPITPVRYLMSGVEVNDDKSNDENDGGNPPNSFYSCCLQRRAEFLLNELLRVKVLVW
jgi:hypothetical protein